MDALVREFLLAANLDLGRTAGSGGPVSLAVVLPPPPTTAPPESWTQMLAAFPPLTSEESMMLIDFVSHPELMMQIRYEQQLAEAKANGRPLPREPTTMLGHEPRQHLHALFTGELIPSHFWPRCRAIFDYVRQHGTDVLAHLPVPVPPLPATEQQWIEEALRSPPKRTYMHYVCARQDALLSGLPVPIEPSVSLSSKERNQIRRTMQDTRAVMFFRKRSASSNS